MVTHLFTISLSEQLHSGCHIEHASGGARVADCSVSEIASGARAAERQEIYENRRYTEIQHGGLPRLCSREYLHDRLQYALWVLSQSRVGTA